MTEYPDLQVHYVGGDPRIKFLKGETEKIDGKALFQEIKKGAVDNTDIVNISNMKFDQVHALLAENGVLRKTEETAGHTEL